MNRACRAGTGLLFFLALPVLGTEMLRELTCEPQGVDGAAGRQTAATVLTVTQPGITARRYALSGTVRYQDVEEKGYLEMWSHFPGGGRFFSRTLGVGPMQPLSGSSGWRAFALPFFITDDGIPSPERLVLNVVLPGRGRVELGTVYLRQFGEHEDPTQVPGQWWGGPMAGLVGGLAGAFIGCLGGLVGALSARGRARRLVLGGMRLLMGLGAIALALGLYALTVSQPYEVYYPLLLVGGLTVVLTGALHPRIRDRYAALELRRMQAQDG